MVWAAPAPAAIALCPRVSTKLVKAAVAALLVGAVLCTAEQHPDRGQGSQGHSQQEKSLILLRTFAAAAAASSHPRPKRSTDRCSEPITTTTIATNPYSVLAYSPEEFNLCLSSDVLMENLEALLALPITVQFYDVMKQKVDQAYPSGIPERQLRRLGEVARRYSGEEISRWPVTSSDTLAALLDPSGGTWSDSQVQQLVSRYLTLGGTLTGPLLREIGGSRLCHLREEQMEQIPAEAIGTAGQLDISACSQSKKELLYRKAREAFASLAGTPSLYYCRLQPYLGGAPAEDLKYLANAGEAIDMDMDTFLSLNPKELQKLSVMDVKNLLGENLWELKEAENEPLVMGWVQRQFQRELDRVLGIGLQGGMEEPTGTTTPAPPTTTASVTSRATVPTPAPPTTPATATSTAPVPVPTTLPTVPTPAATTTPPATQSSTVPHQTPTPSALSSTPPNNTAPPTGSPPATSTATSTAPPALSTTSIAPCSTHQSPTTNTPTPSPVPLLSTTLAPVNPNTTSPSSLLVPAVTSRATTSTGVGPDPAGTSHSTSSPLVPVSTPSPEGTTHPAPATHSTVIPSTHSAASTPVPHPTSAATTTLVSNPSSAPTAIPFPHPTSSPTATRTTITLSTHSAPSTPVPHPTSAPTATHSTVPPVTPSTSAPPAPATNPPPHKPTPPPNSTVSTQKSIISSTPGATTVPCQSSAHPEFPSPSSTTTSGEATKPTPGAVPEPPQPTSNGFINLQPKPEPEPDSGPSLCSCLSHVLAVTVGTLLLQELL